VFSLERRRVDEIVYSEDKKEEEEEEEKEEKKKEEEVTLAPPARSDRQHDVMTSWLCLLRLKNSTGYIYIYTGLSQKIRIL